MKEISGINPDESELEFNIGAFTCRLARIHLTTGDIYLIDTDSGELARCSGKEVLAACRKKMKKIENIQNFELRESYKFYLKDIIAKLEYLHEKNIAAK